GPSGWTLFMVIISGLLAVICSDIGVKSTYGSPVDIDGVRIIPVAVACFGFGAGVGIPSHEEKAEGSGGGGGGMSVPVGAYITRDGTTRFEPNTIDLMAVGVPLAWTTGRALTRIVKALKR